MNDASCVAFLTWALPRLGFTWSGFRRVRRQVCRRIGERLQELRLPDAAAYREYLDRHPEEWRVLDAFCTISISRFYREAAVFDYLGRIVLPALAEAALVRGDASLVAWSAGCASGEEPYSLTILWRLALAQRFPGLSLRVLATDLDPRLLARGRDARYRSSSLRELPDAWRDAAFTREGPLFVLKPEFREGVVFLQHDLRHEPPEGPFDLVLCRYLAFTYFDEGRQRETLERFLGVLHTGGALVVGRKEQLPEAAPGLTPWHPRAGVYRRSA